MMISTRGNNSGFTLLEVMIAIAVMAAGIVPLLVTHAATVRNLRRARELTQAAMVAQSRIGTMEGLGFAALGGDDGSYEEALIDEEQDEDIPYLTVKDEILEEEDLLQAKVTVTAKYGASAKEKERSGVALVSYIVNLYFEADEEEEDLE